MYYDLGHVHSNLGEFQNRFLMQKIRFSVPPVLPRLLSSNVILCDQYLLYVFMYSWVYNGAHQPCFSRCMVDCTLINSRPLEISMKINPNIKTGTSLRLFAIICDEICLLPSFNLILDIPITKLTEL